MNASPAALACVIVTHNRADQLRQTLRATLAQPFDCVLVVDNASTDATPQLLEQCAKDEPRLRLLPQSENLGGAHGFAVGLRAADALLHGSGWVVLYDDDAFPQPGCLATFQQRRRSYEQQGITGVAALVLSPDGTPVEVNRPILNPFRSPLRVLRHTIPLASALRDLYHVPLQQLRPSQPSADVRLEVDAVSFVGLFLRLDSLPENPRLRYPQGRFFIYSDDTTYTLDLRRRGHQLVLDTSLVFVHDTATFRSSQPWMNPIWKHYYVVRNSFSMNRSLSGLFFLPLCLFTVFNHLALGLRYWREQGNPALLRVVLIGLSDGVCRRFTRPHPAVVACSTIPSANATG